MQSSTVVHQFQSSATINGIGGGVIDLIDDESEANLHSFQGNEAGQDLDYEPALEFDDTELVKATIELATVTTTTTTTATQQSSFYMYHNNNNQMNDPLNINGIGVVPPVVSSSSSTTITSGNCINHHIVHDDDVVDGSLILLDDNPLFSIDSTTHFDDDDDEENHLYCDKIRDDDSNHNSDNKSQFSISNGFLKQNKSQTTIDFNGLNHINDDHHQQQLNENNNYHNGVDNGDQSIQNQSTIQATRPTHLQCLNSNNNHNTNPSSPMSSTPIIPIDVSSIYLHSPDELLEENFEEALREQYTSLPPLDPALDLALSGGDCDENFDDITKHGIVGVAGDDKFARKIITIYACRLPSNKTFNYGKFLRYVSYIHIFY